MKCTICGSEDVRVIYDDLIRDGAVGRLTKEPYQMFRCDNCKTIWHDIRSGQNKEYYESEQYRKELEAESDVENYFSLHDKEVLEKLEYTGTEIYRNKRVLDIGAGGGSFLDFVHAVASETIAVEPSEIYRMDMQKRGHKTYPYAGDAVKAGEKADVVTSFDVIEHVDDPREFMNDVYKLLSDGGIAFIGTPTDAPVLRTMLGHTYEQFLFSYQHPWILSPKSLEMISLDAGFTEVKVRQVQRYGLSNAFTWLNEKVPRGHIQYDFIPTALEECFKHTLEDSGQADYIVCICVAER